MSQTGTRYVPIQLGQMQQLLENEMSFERADEDTAWEAIWKRPVVTKSGKSFNYAIKVFSSIDRRTGVSRECGADAIRLILLDTVTGYPVRDPETKKILEARVFRTKSALINLKARARELFVHVVTGPHCPKCSSLMVLREGGPGKHKFYGCSHYAPNNPWHCTGTRDANGNP